MFASLARGIGFLTMIVLVGGLVAFGLGFFWFITQVPSEEIRLSDKADGIVVLTGAASRIPDAIELLNSARGQRVLITGVNRTTTAKEIATLTSANERVFQVLRRSRSLGAQYARQRHRDAALGARP